MRWISRRAPTQSSCSRSCGQPPPAPARFPVRSPAIRATTPREMKAARASVARYGDSSSVLLQYREKFFDQVLFEIEQARVFGLARPRDVHPQALENSRRLDAHHVNVLRQKHRLAQ